jgi:hypothetical protein
MPKSCMGKFGDVAPDRRGLQMAPSSIGKESVKIIKVRPPDEPVRLAENSPPTASLSEGRTNNAEVASIVVRLNECFFRGSRTSLERNFRKGAPKAHLLSLGQRPRN